MTYQPDHPLLFSGLKWVKVDSVVDGGPAEIEAIDLDVMDEAGLMSLSKERQPVLMMR